MYVPPHDNIQLHHSHLLYREQNLLAANLPDRTISHRQEINMDVTGHPSASPAVPPPALHSIMLRRPMPSSSRFPPSNDALLKPLASVPQQAHSWGHYRERKQMVSYLIRIATL